MSADPVTEGPGTHLPSGLRVALVHDWITGFRGGEKVLEVMASLFPEADLYTLIYVPGSSHPNIENGRAIRASWMSGLPGVGHYYRNLLPWFPRWADGLDLRGYDLVLSTSHCVAKGARAAADAVHLCYCHTPMRYVWDRFEDYFGEYRGAKRWAVNLAARRLRAWDRRTAERVDRYLGNSHFVRDRILRFYGIPEERVGVLHPPVEVDAFAATPRPRQREDRYLVVSAMVPYKRIDTAIEAVAHGGRALTVAGTGPDVARLQRLARDRGAGPRIEFTGRVDDAEVRRLMATHRALLHPGVEDFGITMVEAAAAGIPVIAPAAGGALDAVLDGVTGLLYPGLTSADLRAALDRFETRSQDWEEGPMAEHAAGFSRDRFAGRLQDELVATLRRGPVRSES